MEDFENVTDFRNLYRAYRSAKSGKGFKNSSARFEVNALDGVHSLKEQLENKTYHMSGYQEFYVYEPKERLIKACSFKDKVVQHSLCDNVLLPSLRNEFIPHNYAGQIGKGTTFGLKCLEIDMLSFYEEHGLDGWFLKCDISKFFYSINHDILKDIVDYYFNDDRIKWLNHLFIDSTYGLGIPLGNQTSQVYALLYLNGLDHFITGELGIKYYGRSTDDFYLIHHDKNYIKQCLDSIKLFVGSLDLELNGKTQVIPFKNGIDFTGFHSYVTKDGKIIRKIRNQNKRNAQKKYGKMANLVKSGELSARKFNDSYMSYKAHTKNGNCIKMIHSMDCEFKDIGGV